MTKVGLRVDVDTFRGTREGVPNLIKIMNQFNIQASFFFSAGPDNMGRHLWRLLRPTFLWKMLRSRAASLYGPEIILHGTFFPGPMIVKNNRQVVKDCASSGHEIGLHAWDHHYWQSHWQTAEEEIIRKNIDRAMDILTDAAGITPVCSATAGFVTSDAMLRVKEEYNFKYNADCIGNGIFLPKVDGKILQTPQIGLVEQTYDEVIGKNGICQNNYNEKLIESLCEKEVSTLAIHAEAEGGVCSELFIDFLRQAEQRGITFCPLGELLDVDTASLPHGEVFPCHRDGRDAWVSGFRFIDNEIGEKYE